MESFIFAFNAVAPIIALVALGYFLKKSGGNALDKRVFDNSKKDFFDAYFFVFAAENRKRNDRKNVEKRNCKCRKHRRSGNSFRTKKRFRNGHSDKRIVRTEDSLDKRTAFWPFGSDKSA